MMNQSSAISRVAGHAPAFFDTREEALKEVRRRKAQPKEDNLLVFFEPTAYGNWKVFSIPADFMIDGLADGPAPGLTFPGFPLQKGRWAMNYECADSGSLVWPEQEDGAFPTTIRRKTLYPKHRVRKLMEGAQITPEKWHSLAH